MLSYSFLSPILLMVVLALHISRSILCNHSILHRIGHIESLEEWEAQKAGVKHFENALGHGYDYCLHGLKEFADIQAHAMLSAVRLWFNGDAGHAVIEIIFTYRDKFVVVISEAFQGTDDNKKRGNIFCHQFYSSLCDAGTRYLQDRSSFYQLMQYSKIIGVSMSYQDAFTGPIKEINDFYVCHKWVASKIIDGKIELNHGCIWYAINLFSRFVGIPVQELLTNENISQPIIQYHNMSDSDDSL